MGHVAVLRQLIGRVHVGTHGWGGHMEAASCGHSGSMVVSSIRIFWERIRKKDKSCKILRLFHSQHVTFYIILSVSERHSDSFFVFLICSVQSQ